MGVSSPLSSVKMCSPSFRKKWIDLIVTDLRNMYDIHNQLTTSTSYEEKNPYVESGNVGPYRRFLQGDHYNTREQAMEKGPRGT